ncbi:MAG: NAD-dependent epimerase/dehydratase family protein [Deltaproteobacteria bacterium]|nr:NAD-dependent epimerase/dehydratase family protein [Deltaproteobacteria bacterium]
MKVLVIGGNRFFGKRLVALLLEQVGTEVTLLNRGRMNDGFENRVARIKLDRQQLRPAHPALENHRWDVVFDQVCYDAREAQSACETFNGRVGKLIFVSSQSVYGPGPALPESAFDPRAHSFGRAFTRDEDYGEAKRQAEAVYFRAATFPVSAVRFPIVLGEDDYTERLKFHVDHILQGKPVFFPNLDARISLIRSADAALFLKALASSYATGPINCCAQDPIPVRRIIETIEARTGKRAHIARRSDEGDDSPFGVERDWFMSTAKLTTYGFSAQPIDGWLAALIDRYMT